MNRQRLIKYISVFLAISFISIFITSCSNKGVSFPEFSYPSSVETTNTDENLSSDGNNLVEITVALPYSETTINYLARLYYAKQNNLLGVDDNGSDVSLDYLDSLSLPFVIHSVLTPSDGVGTDVLDSWNENSTMPDVFLSSDLSGAVSGDYIIPLNNNLFESSYISSSVLYPKMNNAVVNDGYYYGLPYYFSTSLIVLNRDYIPASGELDFRNDYNSFKSYLEEINLEYNSSDEDLIVPFYSASSLVPYLSSTFSETNMSFMYSSDTDISTLDSVINSVSDLYTDGLSSDTDINGADPRYTRTAAAWLCSTSDIGMWYQYYDNNLYLCQVPSNENRNAVNYIDVYPICISSDSLNPVFATDFASFIAFDEDARLLTSRLQLIEGYFPCINSGLVWNYYFEDQILGSTSQIILNNLINCEITPAVINNDLYNCIVGYNSSFFGGISDNEETESFNFNLEECLGGT